MKKVDVSDLKLLEILNRIPFFKRFSLNERNAFLKQALSFQKCQASKKIINKGDQETNFYIILSGYAQVMVHDDQPAVATLGPSYTN